MKTWLRLTLVTCTVGGGFTLLVGSLWALSHIDQNLPLAVALDWIVIASSVFIIVSGLVLVYDPRRTRLAQVALAIQIPYLSSPLFVYKLISGAGLYTVFSLQPIEGFTLFGGNIWIRFQLGGYSSLAILEAHPLGIGINWVALFLFMMLRNSMRAASLPA